MNDPGNVRYLAVLAILAMLGLAFWLFWRSRRRCRIVAKPILTDNEREFYQRLRKALPDMAIFVQVAMSAYLKPNCAASDKRYWQARGRFAQKYSDFVICDPETLAIRVVIELDDRTHIDARDEARDAMLAEAGIDTLRFSSSRRPTPDEIRRAVFQ